MVNVHEDFYQVLNNPASRLSKAAGQYFDDLAGYFMQSHAEGKIRDPHHLIQLLQKVDPAEIFDIHGNSLVKDGQIKALDPVFQAYNLQMNTMPEPTSFVKKVTSREGISRLEKLGRQAFENLTTGSTASKVIRGAGVGLGAAYTYGGVAKLFTPARQEVTPEGDTIETPAPSRGKALLQIAAGAGVAGASLFLKTKAPGLSV